MMTIRDTVYEVLAEANLDGDYPTARDIADGLGLRVIEVNEALCRLGYSGRVRRLPKVGSRIRWEVVTAETDVSKTDTPKTYASPSTYVMAAVIQANHCGDNPTAGTLANTLSVNYSVVMSALYTLERRGDVTRVHDCGQSIRWKAAKAR